MFSRLRIFRKRIAMVLIITNLQLFDALSSQNHVHFIKIFYSFALWHAQLASEVDHAALGRQLACREHRELDILVFGPPEFALELVHLAHLHLEKLLCPPLVERVPVQQLELGSLLSQLVHLVDLFVVDCRRTCSRLRQSLCSVPSLPDRAELPRAAVIVITLVAFGRAALAHRQQCQPSQ